MLRSINEPIQSGSETRYVGKTGFTAAAVFASAFLMPTGFYEIQPTTPLGFTYTTVSASSPSYKTQPNEDLSEVNPLRKLVEYFLASEDVIPTELASISRKQFFQMYERF